MEILIGKKDDPIRVNVLLMIMLFIIRVAVIILPAVKTNLVFGAAMIGAVLVEIYFIRKKLGVSIIIDSTCVTAIIIGTVFTKPLVTLVCVSLWAIGNLGIYAYYR